MARALARVPVVGVRVRVRVSVRVRVRVSVRVNEGAEIKVGVRDQLRRWRANRVRVLRRGVKPDSGVMVRVQS